MAYLSFCFLLYSLSCYFFTSVSGVVSAFPFSFLTVFPVQSLLAISFTSVLWRSVRLCIFFMHVQCGIGLAISSHLFSGVVSAFPIFLLMPGSQCCLNMPFNLVVSVVWGGVPLLHLIEFLFLGVVTFYFRMLAVWRGVFLYELPESFDCSVGNLYQGL